jgi:hypothetical protein
MFTRILTSEERATIKKFLTADGAKEHRVRNIAYRARKYMPQVEADLVLLHKLLNRYEKVD